MSIDPKDAAIQAVTPVVVAPRFGAMDPIGDNGQRYVVARDGLYLEIRRPFIHMTLPCSGVGAVTPYGEARARIQLLCGRVPRELLERFKVEAAMAAPDEHAAVLTWNQHTRAWRYGEVASSGVSSVSIDYRHPELDPGQWVVVDMHSHGCARAGFSGTDDKDDQGAVKISLVVGNCDVEPMSVEQRICALGMFLDRQWLSLMEVRIEASTA